MKLHSLPESWTERVAQFLIFGALLYAAGYLVSVVAPVLAPVTLSLLFAYFLHPLIERLVALRIRRWLAITAVGTVLLGGAVGLGAVFVAAVVPEVTAALPRLQAGITTFLSDPDAWMAAHPDHLAVRLLQTVAPDLDVTSSLRDGLNTVMSSTSSALLGALNSVVGSVSESAGTLLNLLLIPIFTFYFLMDFRGIVSLPMMMVPPRYHEVIVERASRMDSIVGRWVRGQVQVGLILGVLYAIGLTIAGVRLGWVIGMLAGILNIVPFLGVFFGLVLSIVMALMGDHVLVELVGVAAVFSVVQLLEGNLITPRLVGGAVGMSPLLVMVVLLIGGSLFGFFGLIFSIPAVAAGTVVAKDLLDFYRNTSFYRGLQPPAIDDQDPPA